jgi:D-alanyl-lipoteichoic acid acyltransferase DltB (MBOAT superfamily)
LGSPRGEFSPDVSFTSPVFFLFLAVFLALWPWLRQRDTRRWVGITLASFIFYGGWDWRFVFLMAATGLVDFAAALGLVRWPRLRHLLLWLSVGSNLGVLFFFKYAGFAARESAMTFGWPDLDTMNAALSIVLPVGISFYTFQSLSYTIDVYRGHLAPTRNVFHFLVYLSLFPQLVAGPIIRAVDLLPQLKHPGAYDATNRWLGLERIALGFFKKTVIADNLAPLVNELFSPDRAATLSGAECWLAATLFGLQILCDFSGYSDIAIGIARWLGYSFPENFVHPYSAVGFRQFWSRWHISLSSWFRDYVYIPLGGSRGSPARNVRNLWATLLLSGLWHGASFTFLAWGAFHAALLTLERLTRWPERLAPHLAGRAAGWLFTFAAVMLAWVLFRAESLRQAGTMTRGMLLQPFAGLDRLPALLPPGALVALAAFLALGAAAKLRLLDAPRHWLTRPATRVILVTAGFVSAIFLRGPGNAFIYFQF